MSEKRIIETFELTKLYNGQAAVDKLSFHVNEGEIFGFLGPNGSGKTTTLLMLLGLSTPSEGRSIVCGLDPIRESIKIKSMVGYLPENVGFYPDLDAIQTLDFIADLNNIPKEEAERRIPEVLELVGLKGEARKKVVAYSRGMKQRLGIAEVLIKNPVVLFLDELTLGLDPEGATNLVDLIARLNREKGITVLLSSHNLYQVQRICDRLGIMINGKMVAQGTMEELAEEKFGIGGKDYSLEEIYLRYFQEN